MEIDCKEITIVDHMGCMPIRSEEIYTEILKIADIVNNTPFRIPEINFYDTEENIEKLIEAINSCATSANKFNEAANAPAVKSSVNPYDRKYNKRRFT